ncbi:Cys-Gly metallodipeptidase dug1 [Kalaharituber pfeilii]|nr:Cys-Gly metallodipeptidase dug1 [Kalaharituber pfeilii]
MEAELDKFFAQVDSMADSFIKRLSDAVAIPSVSCEPKRRPEVVKMAEFLEKELRTLGAHVERRDPGKDHTGLQLPPIILGRYGNDSKKRTILVYGHYDVQPANKGDGWKYDPWSLTIDDQNRMYGRGSTDDKGPVLGWLNAIEAHQKANIEFPVNLLMCFEGMEETGSEGLDAIIEQEAQKFFKDTDAVCISDNYWLGSEKPCLTYGLRGVSYYGIEVSGPAQDLHSGVYGGAVMEPMTDLVSLMGSLIDNKGKMKIPNVYDDVAPVTEEEKELYKNISFKMDDLYDAIGSKTSIFEDTENTLMARWRQPSLSLHGIEGAFYGEGAKTVIPAKVVGKFSIRTVPNMDLAKLDQLVIDYLEWVFAKLESRNHLEVKPLHAGKWWVASPFHWNFTAASKASKKVYKVEPDFTREGGSIPVTLTFEQQTKKNVLLLPMGSSNDGAHSTNEKLDRRNYIEGTKLLGTYLHYVAVEPM